MRTRKAREEEKNEKLLKEAKKIVEIEVDFEISELEYLAADNNIEFTWMLEEFKRQFIPKANKKLKER